MTPSRILRNTSYSECVLSAADKRAICEDFLEQGMGVVEYSNAHGLNHSRLSKWMKKFKEEKARGIVKLHGDGGGRPSIIDAISSTDIETWVRSRKHLQNCATRSDFEVQLSCQLEKTAARAGFANKPVKCSRQTVTRIHKNNGLKQVKPQHKTAARIRNEHDVRNAYTMIAVV